MSPPKAATRWSAVVLDVSEPGREGAGDPNHQCVGSDRQWSWPDRVRAIRQGTGTDAGAEEAKDPFQELVPAISSSISCNPEASGLPCELVVA